MDEKCCAMRILFLKCSHSLKLTGRRQVANIMYELSRAARLGLPSFLSAIRWNLSFSIETYFVITLFWSIIAS